jgi:peptidoglycan/LPS O-acetylase OafA/YrhL
VFAPLFWIVERGSIAGFASIRQQSPLEFVVANAGLSINQTSIGGLHSTIPYRSGINGSLWTLSYEFVWYLITGALAILGVLRHPRLAIAVIALLLAAHFLGNANPLASVPLLGYGIASRFGPAFGLGILAYLWRKRIPLDDRLALVAAAVVVLGVLTRTVPVVSVPALGYGLLWAAWRLPLRRFDSRWDLSYGLYIYAFPVQQGLALLGSPALPVPVSAALALAITSGLAFLSYVVVERPALRLKHWTPIFGRPIASIEPARVGEPALAAEAPLLLKP